MLIDDTEYAQEQLENIGYYRLSGYWYPFRKSEATATATNLAGLPSILDTYKEGTNFRTVHDLYVFDRRLRMLTLDAIERIETSVRTQIALKLGIKSTKAHLEPKLLDGNFTKKIINADSQTAYDIWVGKFRDRERISKEEFVVHFRRKYPKCEMPIWIAVELWDFGMMSRFYSGMINSDKKDIAQVYGVSDSQIFESWLRSLNFVRNVCAHHGRLWNNPLSDQPKFPKADPSGRLTQIIGDPKMQTRYYAAASLIRFLLNKISPGTQWTEKFKEHISTFPESPLINLKSGGFPDNWSNSILWADTP